MSYPNGINFRCAHGELDGFCSVKECPHWTCEHGAAHGERCWPCLRAARDAVEKPKAAPLTKRERHLERLRSERIVCWLDGAP